MNAKKAIELKEIFYNGGQVPNWADFREADRLSIEALKRHQEAPDLTSGEMLLPLPGETED